MNKEFELSLAVLADVIDEKTPFAEALKKVFKTNPEIRPLRGNVAGLVGCELRHQIYFDYMTQGFKEWTTEQRRLLCLALANAFFFRRFDAAETREMLKEKLTPEQLAAANPLFDLAPTPENYIPSDVDRKSPTYFALRFNVPEWAVKIINHFGGSAAYQSLRKFARPATTFLRVRTSVLPMASLAENRDFSKASVDGMVTYKGNTPLRKVEDFKKGFLFPERLLTKSILDAHSVSDPSEILLYNGNADTSLEKELIESYGATVGLNIGVPNADERVDVTKLIREKNLRNVNFFTAKDPLNMEVHITGPQKLVIAAPDSTNFDLIPTSPDYLLHFDNEGMDALIEQEKNVLEGASKYVDDGGTLLYIVYTISRKEGHITVANFLKAHPEFKLVSERQYFPYEELETAAYVAELVKGQPVETVPTPLADLASITIGEQPVATPTASGK